MASAGLAAKSNPTAGSHIQSVKRIARSTTGTPILAAPEWGAGNMWVIDPAQNKCGGVFLSADHGSIMTVHRLLLLIRFVWRDIGADCARTESGRRRYARPNAGAGRTREGL
jgi:hypothetical protein